MNKILPGAARGERGMLDISRRKTYLMIGLMLDGGYIEEDDWFYIKIGRSVNPLSRIGSLISSFHNPETYEKFPKAFLEYSHFRPFDEEGHGVFFDLAWIVDHDCEQEFHRLLKDAGVHREIGEWFAWEPRIVDILDLSWDNLLVQNRWVKSYVLHGTPEDIPTPPPCSPEEMEERNAACKRAAEAVAKWRAENGRTIA